MVLFGVLSALDVTAVSTRPPTIVHDLHGTDDFVVVGTACELAGTAVLPFYGRLADVFGRRPVMFDVLAFCLLGSAFATSTQGMD